MPSILLLITQMEMAGGQRALMQHARELHRRGWQVHCVTFYDKGNYCAFFERTYGLPIVNLEAWVKGGPALSNAGLFLRGLFRLIRLLARTHVDVFHAFTHYSNLIGVPLAFLAGIPVRISCQAVTTDNLPGWFQILDRITTNSFLTSRMVAVSDHTRTDSVNRVGIHPDKIIAISNAPEIESVPEGTLDIRQELQLPPSAVIGLVMARLHPLKGHRFLFQAFEKLSREETQFLYILCAGDGEEREALKSYIEENNLAVHIRLLGSRNDVPRLLRDSDFTILPSLSEGMPMCVLESLLAKRAVLATDTDGVREILTDACGILVPPADAESLAQGLRRMLSADRAAMGEAGAARMAERFSLQKQVDDYVALYKEILPSLDTMHSAPFSSQGV